MSTTGPRRPPATAALPPARARVAALLNEFDGPQPLSALVARLGGHPNATRLHLDALVEGGHATCAPLPRSGPGRPPLGWSLTEAGRRALAGDPTRAAHAEMVAAMAAHLAEAPDGPRRARAIGVDWGAGRVDTPSREGLVGVLADLGFDPEEAPDGALLLRTCPLLDAAAEYPEVVCAVHAGLVAGASGSEDARLLPFAGADGCRVELA